MATFIFTLIFIVCILLILVVLVQNSKGGGLDSTFGQGNQILGVKGTTDWLEKATWSLAIALVALCVFSASLNSPQADQGNQNSDVKELINSEANTFTPPAGAQPAPVE